MRSRSWLGLVALAAVALTVAACGSSGDDDAATTSGAGASQAAVTINGAGSTFAAPIYQQWGSELKERDDLTVNYQPVGSGAGIAQLTAGNVDFAGSDPPMKDEEIAAAEGKGEPVHVPTALGAITASYNVDGLATGLKLDGPTLAAIFLGDVTRWDDPRIAEQNPGLDLPDEGITVVHRSDESGTTKGFTGYLADVSEDWAKRVGTDKTVKWPTGTGAKGNDGVAAAVKQTSGSIGYVEQAYALQNGFTVADIENAAGRYVAPTLASTSAAGNGLKVPADLRVTVVGSRDPRAYPIVSQTFAIVYRDLCKAGVPEARAKGVAAFLRYGLSAEGQSQVQQLSYAPLPAGLLAKARDQVDALRCDGRPLAG